MTGRVPVVATLVLLLGAAAILDQVVAEPPADGDRAPGLPLGETLSASWFCADGTASPGGRADEAVLVANLGSEELEALVTVMPGGGEEPATEALAVPAGSTTRLRVADVVAASEPGVVVETFGGAAVVEHVLENERGFAAGPCARGPETHWSFAAGTTVRNSSQYLALFNPFGEDAIVDITFLTATGAVTPEAIQGLEVPRHSRVTVPVHEHVRREAMVGIEVQARTGRLIAERSMDFARTEEGLTGLAVSLGSPEPATEWWFPYSGGDSRVAMTNSADVPADIELSVVGEGQPPEPSQVVVAPQTVVVVDVDQLADAGTADALKVEATSGVVVAEQLVSWGARQPGVATALGSVAGATRWTFAIGRFPDGGGAVAVLNPGATAARVALIARDGPSEQVVEEVTLEPGAQRRFAARQLPAGAPVIVSSDVPVVAARVGFTDRGATLAPGVAE